MFRNYFAAKNLIAAETVRAAASIMEEILKAIEGGDEDGIKESFETFNVKVSSS